MNARRLAFPALFGITVIAFIIGLASRALEPFGDALLAPGYVLPEWYWGAVHDPLQLLLAVSLNVAFYAAIAQLAAIENYSIRTRRLALASSTRLMFWKSATHRSQPRSASANVVVMPSTRIPAARPA